MLLIVLRLLAILIGGFTAWRVLDGSMTSRLFQAPDLAVGAALIIAALLPRSVAGAALIGANGFALGVFAVALADYLVPGRPVNPLLIAGMAVNLASVLLLMPRGSHH